MRKTSHWPLTLGTAITTLFNLVLPLVVVRSLPVEEVGRYKIFFLYMLLVPVIAGSAAIQHGIGYWAGSVSQGGPTIRAAWRLQLFVGAIVLGLGLGLATPLARWLEWPREEVVAFAFAALTAVLSRFYEELCIAQGRIARGTAFLCGFELLRTIAILWATLTFHELVAIYWAQALVTGVKTLVGLGLGARERFIEIAARAHGYSRVLSYSLPIYGSLLLFYLVNYSDQMVLSRFLRPADFALYAVGCLDIRPLQMLEQTVTRVLIPQLATALDARDIVRAKQLHRAALEDLAWVLIPSAVGLATFAHPILDLLYGTRFGAAAGYLVVYSLSYVLLVLPYDLAPRALGDASWMLRSSAIAAVVSVTSTIAATWWFGAFGALFALLLSQAVFRALGIGFLRFELGWRWDEFFPTRTALLLGLSSLGAALGARTLRPAFASDRLWLLSCGAALAALLLIAGARRYGAFSPLRWGLRGGLT